MADDRVQFTKSAARKTKQAVTDYLARTGRGPSGSGPVLFEGFQLAKTLEAINAGASGLVQIYSGDRETAKGGETSSGDDRQLTCFSRGHAFSEGDWCLVYRVGGTGLELLPLNVGACDAELTANMSAASNSKTGAATATAKLLVSDPGSPGTLVDGPTITVTNRSLDSTGLSGDYLVVGRIGSEWRPIWMDC